MINLLRGDFYRVFKSKIFFFIVCITILLSVSIPAICINLIRMFYHPIVDFSDFLDVFFRIQPIYLSLVMCALGVLVVGFEFDGGIIRNKLVAGYSKGQILLVKMTVSFASLLILFVINLILTAIVFLVMGGPGAFIEGFMSSQFMFIFGIGIIQYILFIMFLAVFTSVIAINVEKTAISLVIVAILLFGCNIFSDTINLKATSRDKEWLEYCEEHDEYIMVYNFYYLEDGTFEKNAAIVIDSANVWYRSSSIVTTYNGLDAYEEDADQIYVRYIVGDCVMSLLTGVIGIEVFKRRNTK